MQDMASVLPDRVFVQMRGAAQIKFKLSVAGALHLSAEKVPNWNKLTNPRGAVATWRGHLPLTAVPAAGFNPLKAGGKSNGW
jgi:hypothetical protein